MTYIPAELRRGVVERADSCCEYCLLNVEDDFFPFEIDHIIAEKHRGTTTLDNLCLCCMECNRHKGSDLASIDEETGELVALFHPRRDNWSENFRLNGAVIEPLTAKGRVTVFLLQMNSSLQLEKRAALIKLNRYPCNS